MEPGFDFPAGAARGKGGHFFERMDACVGHICIGHDEHIVEQRAVAFLDLLERADSIVEEAWAVWGPMLEAEAAAKATAKEQKR